MNTKDIPRFELDRFRPMHRSDGVQVPFGNNQLDKSKLIPDFELYSSEGLLRSTGPLKSAFYRMSITVRGTLDMQIGLEDYRHQPLTVSFTHPNQIFAKNNISADAFGYYFLFQEDFLSELVPSIRIPFEFPFFDPGGQPLFQVSEAEMDTILRHIFSIDSELQDNKTGKTRAVKMHLYLLLLEARRSYERQSLHPVFDVRDNAAMVRRFRKLVAQYYMDKRQVAEYAALLAVTPNHLNRVVKQVTGRTASDMIREMLLVEAKSLLKYTSHTVAEIAYRLEFSDPGTFSRFFKKATRETPLSYRAMQD